MGKTKKEIRNQVLAKRNLTLMNSSSENTTATINHKYCNTMMSTKGCRHHHSGNNFGFLKNNKENNNKNNHIIGSSGTEVDNASLKNQIWIDTGIVNRSSHQANFQFKPMSITYKKANGMANIR